MRKIIICLSIIFFVVDAAGAQSCPDAFDVRITQKSVGPSCAAFFSADRCITPGRVYIKAASKWEKFAGIVSSPPTTRVLFQDADLKISVRKDAYEYLYVSDASDREGKAVLGVVAARQTDHGEYRKVAIYRNEVGGSTDKATEYTADVPTHLYQTYIENPNLGAKVGAIDRWMAVPDYDTSKDKSRPAFAYRDDEAAHQYWKIAMKLRLTAGALSCVPFNLVHDARIRFVTMRVFLQHRDQDQVEEFSAEFR